MAEVVRSRISSPLPHAPRSPLRAISNPRPRRRPHATRAGINVNSDSPVHAGLSQEVNQNADIVFGDENAPPVPDLPDSEGGTARTGEVSSPLELTWPELDGSQLETGEGGLASPRAGRSNEDLLSSVHDSDEEEGEPLQRPDGPGRLWG